MVALLQEDCSTRDDFFQNFLLALNFFILFFLFRREWIIFYIFVLFFLFFHSHANMKNASVFYQLFIFNINEAKTFSRKKILNLFVTNEWKWASLLDHLNFKLIFVWCFSLTWKSIISFLYDDTLRTFFSHHFDVSFENINGHKDIVAGISL